MQIVFDQVSTLYDEEFTNTPIGRKQRDIVWSCLEKEVLKSEPMRILEVNCGTGEDALWLVKMGHSVLATDISSGMVEVASSKNKIPGLTFRQADLQNLDNLVDAGSVDLVYSNFGGLNCVSPTGFHQFLKQAANLLKPGGSLVLVVMPDFCWMESLYYAIKEPGMVFRRLIGRSPAVNDSIPYDVFYYNPERIKSLASGLFEPGFLSPVGFFLPPSNLRVFFSKYPGILDRLETLEKWFSGFSPLAFASDHFFFHLTKSNK